jgi:hypothetical protein
VRGGRRLSIVVFAVGVALVPPPPPIGAQMATAERLQAPGFWPTKGTAARRDFLGSPACAACHAAKVTSQATTSMARTGAAAAQSEVLKAYPHLRIRLGDYHYDVRTDAHQSLYTVSDAARSQRAPLGWAFGVGKVGQTFLFERAGRMHEAHASYFDGPKGLGLTPGRVGRFAPRTLEEAAARPLDDEEARRCFGCHTTASSTEGRFTPKDLMPGVTCEACHGPGRAHVEALESGRVKEALTTVFRPSQLESVDSVDFCGACHATWWDVKLAGEPGVAALRSQPHRLQSSACWKSSPDKRLTCTACHDPHTPLVREAKPYDERCLACHVSAGAPITADKPGRSCPKATAECTTCHMPKYEVKEMHAAFTDHRIR